MARRVMDQSVQNGKVIRGRIGISLQDMRPSIDGGTAEGARIAEVSPGSPAEAMGLHKGDIVLKADDRPIRSAAQFRNRIGLARIGEQLKLMIERGGATQNVIVAVGPAVDANASPINAKATRRSRTVDQWRE
jgi:serine protease Do